MRSGSSALRQAPALMRREAEEAAEYLRTVCEMNLR
jgi:hypothetical protein